jgi:hypothetical protein
VSSRERQASGPEDEARKADPHAAAEKSTAARSRESCGTLHREARQPSMPDRLLQRASVRAARERSARRASPVASTGAGDPRTTPGIGDARARAPGIAIRRQRSAPHQ